MTSQEEYKEDLRKIWAWLGRHPKTVWFVLGLLVGFVLGLML